MYGHSHTGSGTVGTAERSGRAYPRQLYAAGHYRTGFRGYPGFYPGESEREELFLYGRCRGGLFSGEFRHAPGGPERQDEGPRKRPGCPAADRQ